MKWLQKLLLGKKDRSASSANVSSFQKESADTYVLRISGVLGKTALDRFQSIAAQDIARGIKGLKVLVLLKEFQGWRQGDDWGNLDFFLQHEANIAKIAVVGEGRWEEETMTFLAAGHRSGEVRYFAPGQEQQARAWMKSQRGEGAG